jgi:hypothetical protein
VESKALLIVVLVLAAVAGAILFLVPKPEQEAGAAAETATWLPQAEVTAPAGLVSPEKQDDTPQMLAAGQSAVAQTESSLAASALPTRRIVASYFHNTTRCVTCRTIEQRARETMESSFAAEVASGQLVWRALNMELKENEHYAIDYSLTSPSLVLTEVDGDREVRFKVLNETWTLVHTKVQFVTYVETEVRAFLEEL